MTDIPSTADVTPAAPPASQPEAVQEGMLRIVWRWSRRLLAVGVAAIATVTVMSLTIDLGRFPVLRERAQEAASKYLERPVHIGAIHALLTPGVFAIDDFQIEGTPDSRPFFTAKRITVSLSWRTLIRRELVLDVTLDDWTMAVESWQGRTNMPPGLRRKREPSRRKIFNKTTVSFVHARRGQFVFDDHALPWTVVAPNLDFSLVPYAGQYIGTARFSGGSVKIQNYLPMSAALSTRFALKGGLVELRHLDLVTDGAESHINGTVDFGNWPAQTYNVSSTVDLERMREIFFADATWRASGTSEFRGVFKIFKDGRSLAGRFDGDHVLVGGVPFTDLRGGLEWGTRHFAVTNAETGVFGGRAKFAYLIEPLGTTGATHRFVADYNDLRLRSLSPTVDLRGLRLDGTAHGHLAMAWPSGKFGTDREGSGETMVVAPDGLALATATLPATVKPVPPAKGTFNPLVDIGPIPLGGAIKYRFGAEGLRFDPSWVATPATYVSFEGRANQSDSDLPFHVASLDWQASSRLLASIMTSLTGPTRAVQVSGYGTFDGKMRNSFRSPRIEGSFAGDEMHVWDVNWGHATGDIVLENKFLQLTNGVIGKPDGRRLEAAGRFALGFRTDGTEQEEIDARVKLVNWPMADLRTAFDLGEWPVDGTVALADVTLRGPYRRPVGSGPLRIERGVAWKEAFDRADGQLRFVPTGVHLEQMRLVKGTGVVTGSAFIGWDQTYGFTAGGVIPIESLDNFKNERAQISGLLNFRATGASRIDAPKYEINGTVASMFIADRGVGSVTGRMSVSDNVLQIHQLDVSSFLQVSASGRIALNDTYDAALSFDVVNSSLHEYLALFDVGKRISGYTKILVSGRGSVRGPLTDPARLSGRATVHGAAITLLDYNLQNNGDIVLALEQGRLTVGAEPGTPSAADSPRPQFRLRGEGTDLVLIGGLSFADDSIDLEARGAANLRILQTGNIRGGGTAQVVARARGSMTDPVLSGFATIENGRLTYEPLRHSLTAINGRVNLNARNIEIDNLRARFGDGDVVFSGSILLDQFVPSEFQVTADATGGQPVAVRYPEGFRSTIRGRLHLTGPVSAPLLDGDIEVVRVASLPQPVSPVGLLGVAGGLGGGTPIRYSPVPETGFPLRFDIRISAKPRTLVFVNEGVGARLEGSGDLTVTGTYDRPILLGTVDIDNGVVNFNGNRIVVTRGSIDFFDPTRIYPSFDVQAEARARPLSLSSPGTSRVDLTQTFHINLSISGTMDSIRLQATSDPWLSETDIVTLLLGATPDVGTVESRAIGSSQQAQARMVQQAAAQLMMSPLVSPVSNVVQRVIPGASVSFAPLLPGFSDRLNPGAKMVYVQRVSPNLYLTYSRTLSSLQNDIVLLEYTQNERVSWILSRNEDRSFALDFRIRHVF